jgi:hypothetical protein
VPVGADAEQLQVDAAEVGQQRVVSRAGRRQVGGPDVRPEQAGRWQIDVVGQLTVDHGAVALGMFGRQPDVLVEQHRARPGEADLPGTAALGQECVDGQRGAAGGQADDRRSA